ncbi:putative transcriptional regulator [Natrinema pellirubrum DSM 15624]|uniref:Transcriptional regulator n=1 Tax=Natrinema pellirubrum (strain DSM 15624 / CIP 106293 / JCM 10476 / NCIMB 786 / 157) TaxID=797303 RepID=L0JJ42_NATP1|nr:putative transcriptional regulator [Natrinema pellirubrum DSM 15624]
MLTDGGRTESRSRTTAAAAVVKTPLCPFSVQTRTVSEEPDVETVGALLEDPTVRTILTQTSQEPMSATTLSTHCDASQPTVYRRLEDLRECGLLVERTRPDPDGGHHRTVYSTNLERITADLEGGELTLRIERREDMADRFTDLIEGI